ncbi:PTS sugar transporter subunit IIA [Pediococcus ethanolidurans]|uniref:PTS system, beta-glucosides-specific IIA component n=1 Tax=Pediococcus ethanolidurans TaxID=319653 RepID=A0A0R2JWR4_9LACO|nr:PTS glucose transporter subunit IIA [Pediococcus ethanolidurans]KRN81507.1 pts family glucose glucoside (glc) porter component iia [Pediococcus ethanolidurans]MBU7563196.1 PTS glucose transporter subunit IIA [Pediococcus ethanolidurans]MCV3315916.1 PTS glucose transporter subunit IIA [Pediococcus ethanolidurans]MCV3327105.1 PTS glucose transporter subunit IIA [Pediococcus ethanolidurans]SER86640.1 PTS system, beta-glucosides-specific IIA component [Pediococcus ethanolidurans]
MFGFGKKKKVVDDDSIYAPVNGEVIDLSEVSDPVFAQKAMGDGLGVKPSDGHIVSPVAGTVSMVASTKHALGLTMANGLEVLIHMGVDTVDLKGAPFTVNVKPGDIVNGGDSVATIDLDQVRDAKLDDVIIVVFTNTADKLDHLDVKTGKTTAKDKIGSVTVK